MTNVLAVYKNIPFTDTQTYMLEDEGQQFPYDTAMVYISREALCNIEKTGEVVVRPLSTKDIEWLKGIGPIKRESRLAVLLYYKSGEHSGKVSLCLRESLALDISKKLNGHYQSVKLEKIVGKEVSLNPINVLGIESISEESYVSTANCFNGIVQDIINQMKRAQRK